MAEQSQKIKKPPFRSVITKTRRARAGSRFAAALAVTMTVSVPAAALTAQEVIQKMDDKERFSYLTGLVDMLSYQHVLAGNQTRAQCVSDAFYNNDKVLKSVYAALRQYPDKAPEGLIILIMKQACGG